MSTKELIKLIKSGKKIVFFGRAYNGYKYETAGIKCENLSADQK